MKIALSNKEKVEVTFEGADGLITVEWVENPEGQSTIRVSSDLPDYKDRVGLIYDSDKIGPLCKEGCSNTAEPYCHCIECGSSEPIAADGYCQKCCEKNMIAAKGPGDGD